MISIYMKYLLATVLLLIAPLINNFSYVVGSIYLIVCGLIMYIYISRKNGNYGSYNSLFSAIWICSIGLSNFKLLDYQREWGLLTWIILALAYLLVNCSIEFCKNRRWRLVERIFQCIDISESNDKIVFIVCTTLFILSLLGFLLTVKICGFVPFFDSTKLDSYSDFYTKFLLLSHFAIPNISICYFLIKKKNNQLQVVLLWVFIFVQLFLIPILSVNRGIFLVSAIIFSVTVFYCETKKFYILFLCLVVSFVGFEIGSIGRHYTNELLNASFKQATQEIPVKNPSAEQDGNKNVIEEEIVEKDIVEEESNNLIVDENGDFLEVIDNGLTVVKNSNGALTKLPFNISPKVLFSYSYFTVSHDNFDLALKYNKEYAYGVQQLHGFQFLMKRIAPDLINRVIPHYQVQSNLNTDNLLGTALYDFGMLGIICFCIFFGMLGGILESAHEHLKNKSSLLFVSIYSYCILLSFFSNFTSQFIFILNIIAVLIIFVVIKGLNKIFVK